MDVSKYSDDILVSKIEMAMKNNDDTEEFKEELRKRHQDKCVEYVFSLTKDRYTAERIVDNQFNRLEFLIYKNKYSGKDFFNWIKPFIHSEAKDIFRNFIVKQRKALLVAGSLALLLFIILVPMQMFNTFLGKTGLEVENEYKLASTTKYDIPLGQVTAEKDAEFKIEGNNEKLFAMQIKKGTVNFKVNPLAVGQEFTVKTAAAEYTVVGTEFTVTVASNASQISVKEGKVKVKTQGGFEAVVMPGMSKTFYEMSISTNELITNTITVTPKKDQKDGKEGTGKPEPVKDLSAKPLTNI
ncbi:MAG: hypothetical protein HPY53_11205 [Brevinematales bacterium]|nr:hypothetical protein [Brevinematales bacterium]